MFSSFGFHKIRMGGSEKDKHYFLVIKEFTASKKKIQKGSLGYFSRSETEELSSAVVECNRQTHRLPQVKQDNLKEISKDEAELLLEIQDIPRRCELLQDEKLFRSICNIKINDVVQVRLNRVMEAGIVKNIKNSTRENGLKLHGAVFQVEMVEAEDRKTKGRKSINVNAGDIIFASNTEVEPPGRNDKESKLHSDDAKKWNKCPAGSSSQQIGLSPRRVEKEKSNEDPTLFLPPISMPDHSKKSSKHYTSKTHIPVMSAPSSPDSLLAESENPALEVESMVEVRLPNDAVVYGVIRWIGTPEGANLHWAGIELDYELKDYGGDGTFGKNRYFKCERNKAIFIPFSSCKPDARFIPNVPKEIPNSPMRAAVQVKTVPDDLTIKEDVPPVREEEALQLLKGRMKGIQGHYNSCYLDSTIFSLFTFTSVLDSILHMPGGHDEKLQRILREDIVNPLRRTGVVNADKVTKLRKLLGCDTFISAEKDPEEFINVLLHEVLAVDPLLKIRSGQKIQESCCYQIILEKDEKVKVPTVQLLLERSFLACDLKFEEIPSCLLLQMPRFGKQFKMFTRIMPSLELDITDLLNNTLRQCFICGEVAEYECAQCLLDPTLNPGAIKQYCSVCNKQVHFHKDRKDHQSRKFPYPRDISVRPPFPRHRMELFAVLCIETSHYVSFVKYGPGKDSWLFFDSMADRIGDENIPEVTDCPQIGDYLMMSEDKLAYMDLKQLDGFAKRLFCDAYMCMYQSPRMCLYK